MIPFQSLQSSKPLSRRYLSVAQREEIAILRVQKHGVRAIARKLRRAPSTISRELRCNAATRSGGLEYRATTAQWHADRSPRRPKPAKLVAHEVLRRYVQERLAGAIIAPDGVKITGPKGGVSDPGSTGGGPWHGARNRFPGACRWIFPLIIRCESVTRRFAKPFTSKAEARCATS